MISFDENDDQEWTIDLTVNKTFINVKIDLPAEANIIPLCEYRNIRNRPKLHKPRVKLTAYNGTNIPVEGSCILYVENNNICYPMLFIVAYIDSQPKECSKEPVTDQITPSKHSTVLNINSNQALSKEPIRDRKIKTNRSNAPTTTIIGEPVTDQITPSKHSTVLNINSNQALSKEPIRDRKIKTNRSNAPTTTIIGDSMIKKVFGNKLSRELDNKHHIVVQSFGGAKTQCMEDYIKPTVKLAPK